MMCECCTEKKANHIYKWKKKTFDSVVNEILCCLQKRDINSRFYNTYL